MWPFYIIVHVTYLINPFSQPLLARSYELFDPSMGWAPQLILTRSEAECLCSSRQAHTFALLVLRFWLDLGCPGGENYTKLQDNPIVRGLQNQEF